MGMGLFDFYKGKRVFITGHTGFKGSWMCEVLKMAGASVTGYALNAPDVSLYNTARISEGIASVIGDIRDADRLKEAFDQAAPEIVIHMAAQPIVRESYKEPAYTYETNVMGTVNILECVRKSDTVRSFVNVTTDKVYLNRSRKEGFKEGEELNGYDPYSNSKSCSELVTQTYKRCFFDDTDTAISTARAGNVIGGGDHSVDRIIPDCIRAVTKGDPIIVRNPGSVRPYQHVLEPVYAYLLIAMKQFEDRRFRGSYNIGPDEKGCVTTGELADKFCSLWGEGAAWINKSDGGPHEDNFLKLDCSLMKETFGWAPLWDIDEALKCTIDWTKCAIGNGDVRSCMHEQISRYINGQEGRPS
ncbi:MAG: CDP-glucose 4,6-dehydratase [Lachnospiraceae bacterium]|nr:CDP-glucose 4,6-dehydratase [Lachnospiraceae bacterium]